MNRLQACALALALAGGTAANAERLNWTYLDIRYQQPEESNIDGVVGDVSANISPLWLIQGRIHHTSLDDGSTAQIDQTRYDVSVARLFPLGNRVAAVIGAGYTHIDTQTDIDRIKDNVSDHAGHVRAGIRAGLGERLEGEASVGMLFDEDDTSDPLWAVALRYYVTPGVAVHLGANGSDDNDATDNVLYELGIRFDLTE